MKKKEEVRPHGLTRGQLQVLEACSRRAAGHSLPSLLEGAREHLRRIEMAAGKNRLVNLRLAAALHRQFGEMAQHWGEIPGEARPWLAGAVLYFSSEEDDEPDTVSAIGLEDDLAVFNACLQMARLDRYCLRAEDFDDG
ncbi:MAG: hypothetical protein ACOYNR_10565 [Blastocatellia bacterium]